LPPVRHLTGRSWFNVCSSDSPRNDLIRRQTAGWRSPRSGARRQIGVVIIGGTVSLLTGLFRSELAVARHRIGYSRRQL
jgi:hypothetical protein